MGINMYQKTQNDTDNPNQLSIRVVRSIYLYCCDWSDPGLSMAQKRQSLEAGQVLCDTMVRLINDDLDLEYQETLIRIFAKTSLDLFKCQTDPHKSLYENERALLQILKILENKQ